MSLAAFPFIGPSTSLVVLRVVTALLFIAHAAVRLSRGTIPQFGAFLETKGLPIGAAWVWAITTFEIVGGIALAVGLGVRGLAAGFCAMLVMGIVLVHAQFGWFVGEHGTGGSEYSVALLAALVAIAGTAESSRPVMGGRRRRRASE